MTVEPSTRTLLLGAALLLVTAMPALASRHTSAECREGGEPEETQGDDGERWRSAFDDEGSERETSNEENRG